MCRFQEVATGTEELVELADDGAQSGDGREVDEITGLFEAVQLRFTTAAVAVCRRLSVVVTGRPGEVVDQLQNCLSVNGFNHRSQASLRSVAVLVFVLLMLILLLLSRLLSMSAASSRWAFEWEGVTPPGQRASPLTGNSRR